MAPKRHLGLGKAAKVKKQKTESEEPAPSEVSEDKNELTVEMDEEVDANDAVGQLVALWRTFLLSEEKKELMLNGIIHECDRLLRKKHNSGETSGKDADDEIIDLNGQFHAIYAQALSSLAFFHTEEEDKVAQFFTAARERIQAGREQYPESIELLFGEARILMNRIPLVEVSQLTLDSKINKKHPEVAKSLDHSLSKWEEAVSMAETRQEYKHFNLENLDFLQALDDFLDMSDNFGKVHMEGEDSDDEDDEDKQVDLAPTHPLHSREILKNLDLQSKPPADLRRELCKRLGQSYLMEAEIPSSVFTTLTYYSKGQKEINGLTKEKAQKISQELFNTALKYLKDAQDEQDPDTWANVAEAMISLANTHDLESKEQESIYKEAEDILTRANNATNGKYDDILENLLLN
ncbi:CIC11C00000003705 [Sungouiella intermedia]|uniref:Enhancer of translation termination 1 n=1 Tax=Sungouiella intermedia TaxID=45354 RepID=A0A1L0FXL1_9ASCO|nr:CIC11C00000003705 [[Candida] intermedia]